MVLPTITHGEEWEDCFRAHIEGLRGMIQAIYGRTHNIEMATWQEILSAAHEALVNACYHGNRDDTTKQVDVGIWFGKTKIMLAFRDEGNFYSKTKTRERVDAREMIEPDPNDGLEHNGCGLDILYDLDEIFVDTQSNTLYLVHTLVKETNQCHPS